MVRERRSRLRWVWGISAYFGLATVSLLSGCHGPILNVDDAVITPGHAGQLSASVSYHPVLGMCKEITNAGVRFFVGGEEAGQAQTDRRGLAALLAPLTANVTRYEARALTRGRELQGFGRVFAWDPERVVIAVDIDDTIAHTKRRGLLEPDRADDLTTAFPHAAEVLSDLARDFQIVYLTGRPRFLLETTREWLRAHDFPAGPVVTARGLFDMFWNGSFKRARLAELRQAWPNVLIGIGDETRDLNAYRGNGMLSITLAAVRPRGLPADALRCADWAGVREFFAAQRETLADAARLRAALTAGTPWQAAGLVRTPEHALQ